MVNTTTKLTVWLSDMGSSSGPVLANIVMCHFEEKWVLRDRSLFIGGGGGGELGEQF